MITDREVLLVKRAFAQPANSALMQSRDGDRGREIADIAAPPEKPLGEAPEATQVKPIPVAQTVQPLPPINTDVPKTNKDTTTAKLAAASVPTPKQKEYGQRAAKKTVTSEEASKPGVINDPKPAEEPAEAAPHQAVEPTKSVSPAEYEEKVDSELKQAAMRALSALNKVAGDSVNYPMLGERVRVVSGDKAGQTGTISKFEETTKRVESKGSNGVETTRRKENKRVTVDLEDGGTYTTDDCRSDLEYVRDPTIEEPKMASISAIIKAAQGEEDAEQVEQKDNVKDDEDWRFGSETAPGPMGYLGGRTLQGVAELARALGAERWAPRIGEWAKDPTISQLTGTGVTALGALGGGYLLNKLLNRGGDDADLLDDYYGDFDLKYAAARDVTPSATMEKINAALSGEGASPDEAKKDRDPWARDGRHSVHRDQNQRRTEAFFADPKIASDEKRAVAPELGALVGLFRQKDPGERRRDAVLRSLGTGVSTWLGGAGGALAGHTLGKYLGGKLKSSPEYRRTGSILGALLGAGGGGLLGYQLAKREPRKEKIKRILIELAKAKQEARMLREAEKEADQLVPKSAGITR